MHSDEVIRAETRAEGLRIKRNNLLAAALSGAGLASISLWFFPHSLPGILGGFVLGFFYANGFEYCLHRFILHGPRGFFRQQHIVHHATLNSPEMARYVNFSRNPWGVVGLFLANAAPFLLLQWYFRNGWTAGVFIGFAVYYVAFEEIHWRMHMGGRLPRWLRPAARHHLLHHAQDAGGFNVFLPIFDRIAEWFRLQPRIHSDEPER
jgi:sterol desaturase/sphingolipid hydroxylase (fatty acid hydroxylase superfamily)